MVLESLFFIKKIRERKIYYFLFGIIYSFISILVALYLFPRNFIIFAIALTSLLFLPMINKLLGMEKDIELKRKGFGFKGFIKDHSGIFRIYLYIFLGIALSFAVFSILTPGIVLDHLLENQAVLVEGLYYDSAVLSFPDFFLIIANNIKVVIVCYLAAYFFGTGAIFIISWNASVWGIIFGAIAKNAALATAQNPFLYFFLLSIVVLPHLIIEASAYFLSGISGGIVSIATISEGAFSENFRIIARKSLILLWISLSLILAGAFVESQITPQIAGVLLG